MSTLYLFPNLLSEGSINSVIPAQVIEKIKQIKAFATENCKNTRRFLKSIDKSIDIDSITFIELNEHSDYTAIAECAKVLKEQDMGVISEAGCPGIADPGADLVAYAHKNGIKVVPFVGPSSILLALIASGSNGQCFAFNGYLPVKEPERGKALKNYEQISRKENRTQIFIETPYRNEKFFAELLERLSPATMLTVACNITAPDEYIKTLSVQEWRKHEKPSLHKKPAIFLFLAKG